MNIGNSNICCCLFAWHITFKNTKQTLPKTQKQSYVQKIIEFFGHVEGQGINVETNKYFLTRVRFTISNPSYFLPKGFLELALQEHYTALPDSGQTHMTIYNGLPPSCASDLNLIQLNYIPKDPEKSSISFPFYFTDSSGNHSLYSESSGIENEALDLNLELWS